MRFNVGMAICNEPASLIGETIHAIHESSARPSRVILIDNSDHRRGGVFTHRGNGVECVRPESNLGCAGAWNLIHKLSGDVPTVIVNADTAVASDTFERMLIDRERLASPVVLAYGFGCFLIDKNVRDAIGDFDEGFWPVYCEDVDYRHRMKLADIIPVEWPIDTEEIIVPGRVRAVTGIIHGKHDEEGYQGWRGEKLAWFHERLEANKRRYVEKWGGTPYEELYMRPYDPSSALK